MLQTRVGYAGGAEPGPTYHDIGGHAEAVRVTFDPRVVSLEELLGRFCKSARGGGSGFGQYRSQVFPRTEVQRAAALRLVERASIPVAAPGTDEARFWGAEDYHQKYRLRRDAGLVARLNAVLGPRWDEHVWATKLNGDAAGLARWLEEMPGEVVTAFRKAG